MDSKIPDKDIQIDELFDLLKRNKSLVSAFTFSGLIISGLIAFLIPRTWQGEFQIVIESSSISPIVAQAPEFINIPGLTPSGKKLQTEVGILESSSILMNVFDFVKSQKSLAGEAVEKLRFKDWKEAQLDIKLEKKSSILNIAYQDTDKGLIEPVLNKISNTYQDYSGRQRLRDIDLGMKYFKEQISLYKVKRVESLKKSQEFATSQDLILIPSEDFNLNNNTLNVEMIRIKAADQIRKLNKQLENITKIKGDPDQIMYIASTIPGLKEAGLADKLQSIDEELTLLRVIYTEHENKVKDLIKERDFFIKLLKRQVIGFLKAQKIDAEARLKSAERPEGVILKYRELLSQAVKDERTLDKLENEYRTLSLEKARYEDPWKLITKPTLLPNPIAPRKKRILSIGIIAGFFSGFGIAGFLEKRKKKIFSISQIKSLVQWRLIVNLATNDELEFAESLDLLASGPLSKTDGDISFLLVGEVNSSDIKMINNSLSQSLKGRKILITDDFLKAIKSPNLITLLALGGTTSQEMINIDTKLLLQDKSLLGLIVLG